MAFCAPTNRDALSRATACNLCAQSVRARFYHCSRRGQALAAPPLLAQRSPDFAELDRYVAKAARDWHVPGLAIAVVKDDSLVFAKGYGVIEIGKPALVNEHTRFAIGSTTKAMTVAALGDAGGRGKASLGRSRHRLIPDFRLYDPYVTREVTLRDLLTHRTGLPGTDLFWVIPENTTRFQRLSDDCGT